MRDVDDEGLLVSKNSSFICGGNGADAMDSQDLDADHCSKSCLPDPQVYSNAKRRLFSASYKVRIVEEADRCTDSGEIGSLLRREGLYSSLLSKWRIQYRAGALDALRDDKRGRKSCKHPLEEEVSQLRKENARLLQRLEHAEAIIDIQKKVSAMLGHPPTGIEPTAGD
jgi:transposase